MATWKLPIKTEGIDRALRWEKTPFKITQTRSNSHKSLLGGTKSTELSYPVDTIQQLSRFSYAIYWIDWIGWSDSANSQMWVTSSNTSSLLNWWCSSAFWQIEAPGVRSFSSKALIECYCKLKHILYHQFLQLVSFIEARSLIDSLSQTPLATRSKRTCWFNSVTLSVLNKQISLIFRTIHGLNP